VAFVGRELTGQAGIYLALPEPGAGALLALGARSQRRSGPAPEADSRNAEAPPGQRTQARTCRDKFDSFRMEVPDGLQITLTEYLVENLDGTAETLLIDSASGFTDPSPNPQATWGTWNAGASLVLFDAIFDGSDPDPGPNSSSLVFGPGLYDVVNYNWNEIGGGAFRLEITATAIPEPRAALLLAIGLLVLVRRGR
jgi:hypothetical protein